MTTSPLGCLRAPRCESVVPDVLRGFEPERDGSIALEDIEASVSEPSEAAARHAKDAPTDAVVWEEVQARTEEQTELWATFVASTVLAGLLAAVAIFLRLVRCITLAHGDRSGRAGSVGQLLVNLTTILLPAPAPSPCSGPSSGAGAPAPASPTRAATTRSRAWSSPARRRRR